MKRFQALTLCHLALGFGWIVASMLCFGVHTERVHIAGWSYLWFQAFALFYLVAGRILFDKSQKEIDSQEFIKITPLGILNTLLTLSWLITLMYMALFLIGAVLVIWYIARKHFL